MSVGIVPDYNGSQKQNCVIIRLIHPTDHITSALPAECRWLERANEPRQRRHADHGAPIWSPHKLRHSAATMLRKQFGLDAARTVLGHRSAAITEVYAELDQSQAETVMLKVG